jgi:DNA-binding Lrp family transcriptional regulator
MTISDLDSRLLTLLRANARTSMTDLAKALGVSRSTVQMRLDRLERDGVIGGYTIRFDGAEPAVRAYVGISIYPREQAAVEAGLRRVPAVTSLFSVSGPHDFIAIMTAPTTSAFDKALDDVRALSGVKETLSSIILSRKFERG